MFHLVQDHPVIDGNKRIGLAALLVFLGLNSHGLDADPEELESLVRSVAVGKATKAEVAVFVQRHMQPRRR